MYGQFHNELSLTAKKFNHVPATHFLKKDSKRKNIFAFISLLLMTLLISSQSFAGPSQPRLKGGNGNAQGR